MSTITVTKSIKAPIELVFKTISDIRNFSKAVDDIINVEFLTSQEYGVGTKFKETRNMNGRETSTELVVTELKENEYIRLVSDAGGTIWDSVFKVKEKDGETELSLVMEAKPYKFLAKLITPFLKGMMKKALDKDLEATKNFCERKSG
jgi:hypothetical protein